MLGGGESLVTQVVPAELMDMSTNVLRRALSNIWPRRIFTLTFGRYSLLGEPDKAVALAQSLSRRLQHARAIGGIVLSTPTAVKSMVLTYLELLGKSANTGLGGDTGNVDVADELSRVLRMFSRDERGVLLLDEVDLLLHPLKSELNFPIGTSRASGLAV